jgi:spore cortex formation protein SpoVR/YcgB (stage V sporulation)
LQYLSPKLIRDLKLFCVADDAKKDYMEVSSIHNEDGYQAVREALSAAHDLSNMEPNIEVYKVDTQGDRTLHLRHERHEQRPLDDKSSVEMLKHVRRLWGFDVQLDSRAGDRVSKTYHCAEDDVGAEEKDTEEA